MSPRASGAALLVLALVLAGCSKGEDAPVDPCPRADAPSRALAGALVRQPVGTGLFEILGVEGKARRSGRVGKFDLGDYTFRARQGEAGGLDGRRGARAEPVPGFAAVDFLEAYAVSYRKSGQAYVGRVAVGTPTPGAKLPTTGQARFRGPVQLTLRDLTPGAPAGERVAAGTADVTVSFGSRQATLRIDGLGPEAAPVARLDWTGIGMCNVRLGSTGQGGFRMAGAGGQGVNFAGPGDGSPNGSAMIDATFYGFDPATGLPAGVGGVLLIQGDTGLVSGIFAAGPTN